MNRDKQIEEMAKDICECFNENGTCYQDDKPCDCRCDSFTDAQYLYEKGYRKASEVEKEIADLKAIAEQYQKQFEECYEEKAKIASDVAREIFEEIEKTAKDAIRILDRYSVIPMLREAKTSCYKDLLGYIAELKKKYTEDGK